MVLKIVQYLKSNVTLFNISVHVISPAAIAMSALPVASIATPASITPPLPSGVPTTTPLTTLFFT